MNNQYFLSKDLFFEISLIGYKSQGESVVMCLKAGNEDILWTAVIDCFKTNDNNITAQRLEEMGYGDNRKIDLLMITHPDLDHIKDIDTIIDKFMNEKTKILMPDFFNSNIIETECIKNLKEKIKERFFNRKSGFLNNLFFNKVVSEPELKWKWIGADNKAHILKVESFLPTDSIMTMSRYVDNQQKNDYSLFVNIIIDDVNFSFTGDCLDYALALLNYEDFEKMKETLYFKIPHHGSNSTKSVYQFIKNGDIVLLSTSSCAYRKDVTDNKVLEFYMNNSPDYLSITSSKEKLNNYGIVKHVYDIKKKCIIKEKCEEIGNGILNYKKLA